MLQTPTRRQLLRLVSLAGIAGLAGGVSMVPVAIVLKRVLGYSLNIYGELVVEWILGRSSILALVLEHLVISWLLAIPLAAVLLWFGRRVPVWGGVAYGAGLWLALNSLALPALFSWPTPWALGWSAIWPSLAIHVLYGVATATALRTLMQPSAVVASLHADDRNGGRTSGGS